MGNKTYQWRGKIVRTEGAFDPSTRMLYVVAKIEKPFITSQQRPAVRIGQFMRAKIEGKQYKQVFVIPRRAVSQNFVVSIVDNGLLKKKKIVPLWTDTQVVVVSSQQSDEILKVNYQGNSKTKPVDSLNNSDTLILTPTANLPDGTKVKPLNDSDSRKQPEIKKPLVAKSSSNREQIDSAVSASNIVSVTAKAQ
jgi:hypothetical protein